MKKVIETTISFTALQGKALSKYCKKLVITVNNKYASILNKQFASCGIDFKCFMSSLEEFNRRNKIKIK